MWKVKYAGKKLKPLIHMVGLSCLLGTTYITLLLFIRILTQGYFHAEESDQLILYVEIVFSVFAVLYSLYLFKRFLGDAKK